MSFRDSVSRFRLRATAFRNSQVRFNLFPPNRNTVSRFALRATVFRDSQFRFIQAGTLGTKANTVTRFTVVASDVFGSERFANVGSTVSTFLSSAMLAADLNVSVASNAILPVESTGTFRILVDSEIMVGILPVLGSGPYTFKALRGAENTTATAHSSGAQVFHIVTAGSLKALSAEPLIDSATGQFIFDGLTGDILMGT